jgi:hypothetical protein
MPDLLGGRVQIYIATLTTTLPYIQSGALRALAVTGKTRFDKLPDVPTVDEFVPGYEVDPIAGLGVRKGTPPEIIEKLNGEINAGLADSTIKARVAELAAVPLPMSATEFGSHMAAETGKWLKSSGRPMSSRTDAVPVQYSVTLVTANFRTARAGETRSRLAINAGGTSKPTGPCIQNNLNLLTFAQFLLVPTGSLHNLTSLVISPHVVHNLPAVQVYDAIVVPGASLCNAHDQSLLFQL